MTYRRTLPAHRCPSTCNSSSSGGGSGGGTGGTVDLSNYVQKEPGKGLSSNDYITADKLKVDKLGDEELTTNAKTAFEAINELNSDKAPLDHTHNVKDIYFDTGDTLADRLGSAILDTNAKTAFEAINELYKMVQDLIGGGNLPDLSDYVKKEPGKGLSTNDYTDADKAKVNTIGTAALLTQAKTALEAINELYNMVQAIDPCKCGDIYVNILDFGAKGDDATDNTDAIQAAIDSVTTGNRATIYVPDGIFRINRPIKLKKEITVMGNGISSVIKEGSSFAGSYMFYTEDVSTAHTNVTVRDLEFRGLKNKAITAIRFNSVYWGMIRSCRVIDLGGNGIEICGNKAVTETCYLYNNLVLYCLGHGIYTNSYTRDIHIWGGDIGCHGKDGIQLNALSSTVTDVFAVWGNGSNGIYEAGENNQIRCNNIEGNVGYGVYAAGKKLMITSNKFTANQKNSTSPLGHIGTDSAATKTYIGDNTFLNNVETGKPVNAYSIANYGKGTVIGSNYYESTDKVLSAQTYEIVSTRTV